VSGTQSLELQVCSSCGAVQYPRHEVCRECLNGELEQRTVNGAGSVLSWTRLHVSLEPEFRNRVPWCVVSVHLAVGPVVIAHWAGEEPRIGQAVRIATIQDPADRYVLVAMPAESDVAIAGALFDK
jgi:uncharacterized OB-fold protein